MMRPTTAFSLRSFLAMVFALSITGRMLGQGFTSQQIGAPAQSTTFNSLEWRNIGPFRGGRATGVGGIPSDPFTYYMGTAGGGVYKTTNAGISWINVSDGFFKTASVGAIAVAPSDPNVIYVGMGESTARANTLHPGDGVYKSTDAGKTWRHFGLESTQVISRIQVDPKDPNLVYVAAQGALYEPTNDRGVYRTTDGGTNWKRVLFVSETTGAADLSVDPNNSKTLYAAMWDHQRTPWELRDIGPGSAIYKSTDGGDSWRKLAYGFPEKFGRNAVAATSDPKRVYALISTQTKSKSGLYRSDDAGESWKLVNTERNLTRRSWYYVKLFVDPNNPDVIWFPNILMFSTKDAGKTCKMTSSTPHSDRHEMWINPKDSRFMIASDDGGASVSLDGGRSWSPEDNQSTAQIYRVVTDNKFPYKLYGAQQDNTTVAIPSASDHDDGIGPHDWTATAGWESSFLDFDPNNPDPVYASGLLGDLVERSETGLSTISSPYPLIYWANSASRYAKYRYPLNAAILVSKHDPKKIYYGAQKLLETEDQGRTWREVSPDLTLTGMDPSRDKHLGTGLDGDSSYSVIIYAAESSKEPGLLWTGSDDGVIGISRDAGATWYRSTLDIGDARINSIDPSPHDPAVAYLAASRFQFNDYTPYFYKTNDYGRTWRRIGAELPVGGWAQVIREDPVRRSLLYAGTELGVYVSFDDGSHWQALESKLPITPVVDLLVHDSDLAVATSGRGFWILDDVTPLRQWDPALTEDPIHLFTPRAAVLSEIGQTYDDRKDLPVGKNPPYGVILDFYLSQEDPVDIEITDQSGKVMGKLSSEKDRPNAASFDVHKGMNRVTWNMQQAAIPMLTNIYDVGVGGGPIHGRFLTPGAYKVEISAGKRVATAPLEVLRDPRAHYSAKEYDEQTHLLLLIEKDLLDYRDAILKFRSVRTAVDEVTKKASRGGATEALKVYSGKLAAADDTEVYAELCVLHNHVNGLNPRVNKADFDTYEMLHRGWRGQATALQAILGPDLQTLNNQLVKEQLPAIVPKVEAPPSRSGQD